MTKQCEWRAMMVTKQERRRKQERAWQTIQVIDMAGQEEEKELARNTASRLLKRKLRNRQRQTRRAENGKTRMR